MTRAIRIAPSLLSADFAISRPRCPSDGRTGADILHFDVMDNHYVPNLTVGPLVCAALRPHTSLPIDVHLMTRPVDPLIDSFAEAGADMITFHPEASDHVHRSVQMIRKRGLKAGVALNPASPLSLLDHILEDLDLVLIMSVNPGFGGQSFIPSALPKIAALANGRRRACRGDRVDGGVNPADARALARPGPISWSGWRSSERVTGPRPSPPSGAPRKVD
nr:pentose-5-phosphate 3-epimerase [Rhodospirillum rubrum]